MLPGRVQAQHPSIGVEEHERIVRTCENGVEVRGAFPDRRLGAKLFGDVGRGAGDANDIALGIAQRERRKNDVDPVAVSVQAVGLHGENLVAVVEGIALAVATHCRRQVQFGREQLADWPANRLSGGVAIRALGA